MWCRGLRLLPRGAVVSGLALLLSSCVNASSSSDADATKWIAYEGISDPAIFLFSDGEMYSGFPPVDIQSSEFQESFYPTSVLTDKDTGAACLVPSPPLDSAPSPIAIGAPPSAAFTGDFLCGKFRFKVSKCDEFPDVCVASFIRVYRIADDKLVNSYFWDKCRGVFLFSNADLTIDSNWTHAFVPTGSERLFKTNAGDCLPTTE